MTCPHCAAVLPDDDLFCEECGQKLASADAVEMAPLCLCGAPDSDLDADGYCLQCGRRCRPAPGEHQEIELSLHLAAVTDRGLRHARNEDHLEIASDGNRIVMVLCDGVSNSMEAEKASKAAASSLAASLLSGSSMETAFGESSQEVKKLAHGTLSKDNPSTTAVAAMIENGHALLGWLGDSRGYWIGAQSSRQLTNDHSWLNEVVSSGELNYAQAANRPQSHAITRWIGADADPAMSPETTSFEIPGPGYLLLCTDGLWNHAPNLEDLAKLVLDFGPDATALDIARGLVTFANRNGGHDNVTVALLKEDLLQIAL